MSMWRGNSEESFFFYDYSFIKLCECDVDEKKKFVFWGVFFKERKQENNDNNNMKDESPEK